MRKIFLQKYALLATDSISLVFTYWLSVEIANLIEPVRLHRFDSQHLVLFKFLNVIAFLVMFGLAELYTKRRPTWEEVRIIYRQELYLLILDFVVISLSGSEHVTYLFFFLFWALLFIILPLFRALMIRILWHYKLWQRDIYIIGSGETAVNAIQMFKHLRVMGYNIKGLVSFNSELLDQQSLLKDQFGYQLYSFDQLMARSRAAEVVVALDSLTLVKNLDKIFKMQRHFLAVSMVPDFDGLPLYGIEVNHFFGSEQLLLRLENNLNRRLNRWIKTVFDYGLVISFLPLIVPVMLIIAGLIVLEDGGSPFFVQPRLGRNGRSICCFKFRTMHKDAENMLSQWRQQDNDLYQEYITNNFKLKADPRITRIGRFLRTTSLDELAQLINVLKGEMSLVGPRPLLARELPDYNDGMFYYGTVRPGITGMWQVSGRSKTSFYDRCRLDTWYIKNWSLWYDIVILIKTIGVVLKREGAH